MPDKEQRSQAAEVSSDLLYNVLYFNLEKREREFFGDGRRLAYYTSAETAFQILQHDEIYLRNALCMNDLSEMRYGISLLDEAIFRSKGSDLIEVIDSIHEGTSALLQVLLQRNFENTFARTYIACFSEHTEDAYGRLSMWRAYGRGQGICFAFSTNYLEASDIEIGATLFPVEYADREKVAEWTRRLSLNLASNKNALKKVSDTYFALMLSDAIFTHGICIKHPVFEEEREWRLILVEKDFHGSSHVVPDIVCIKGQIQTVYKLALKRIGEIDLSLLSMLDRVIVGPMSEPSICAEALGKILKQKGFDDVNKKLFMPNIPLRVG